MWMNNKNGIYCKEEKGQTASSTEAWKALSIAMDDLKALLKQADKEALKHQDQVPAALGTEVEQVFQRFVLTLNALLGEEAGTTLGLSEAVRQEIGAWLQQEMLPYLLLTRTAERCYAKPRGYA